MKVISTPWSTCCWSPNPTQEEIAVADFSENDEIDVEDFEYFLTNLELTSTCTAPDWTHSYSARLYHTTRSQIKLVRDDGTTDIFTSVENELIFHGPPGVFETITVQKDGEGTVIGYLLTTKSQHKAHFYGKDVNDGLPYRRLDWVADASVDDNDDPANKVTCHYYSESEDTPPEGFSYPAYALAYVEDASGRDLTLEYNEEGMLRDMYDPGPQTRTWHLYRYDSSSPTTPTLDGTGEFIRFVDTLGQIEDFHIDFEYDTDWNITAISDKEQRVFSFQYTTGRLTKITDPDPDAPGHVAQAQEFVYEGTTAGLLRTTYDDRREKIWYYRFDPSTTNFVSITDPLNHSQYMEYTETGNLIHEMTRYTNALGQDHHWDTTHDAAGNVETRTDPLGHMWEWQYDSLNNLTHITPPDDDQGNLNTDKQVVIEYDVNGLFPTSPTTITQPNTDQDEDVITHIAYYDADDIDWYGLVKTITDPNGVITEFTYDDYGQLASETGGKWAGMTLGGGGSMPELYVYTMTSDPNGITTSSGGPNGGGSITSDGNGNPTGQSCTAFYSTPPAPNTGEAWGAPPTCEMVPGKMVFCGGTSAYDNMANVLAAGNCVSDPLGDENQKAQSLVSTFDELHRRTERTFYTDEPLVSSGDPWSRQFTYDPNWANGTFSRVGPDGQETTTILDDAGRVLSVERNDIVTQYDYDEADRLTSVVNDNGTETIIAYDDANRVTSVHDKVSGGTTILKREFTEYSADGLILEIDEFEDSGSTPTAELWFVYDNLNRLTWEGRDGLPGPYYYLEYTYDAGGNRRTKVDWGSPAFIETIYTYDIDDPETYLSNENRLLKYEVFDVDQNPDELLETVWYTYHVADDPTGNPRQIIRKSESESIYHRTYFNYDNAGRAWIVARGTFEWDGNPEHDPTDCEAISAREFRYFGSGRARYLMRDRNPQTLAPLTLPPPEEGFDPMYGIWTDYDGDTVYGDYALSIESNELTATRTADHMPGIYQTTTQPAETNWYHSDQVGTTRAMTASNGSVSKRLIYTAFGEKVDEDGSVGTRYGYCGASGYEGGASTFGGSSNDDGLLHIGERLYDPAIGRFLQRDPIGIRGGLNVYAYVGNTPIDSTDPTGEDRWIENTLGHNAVIYGNKDIGYWKIEVGLRTVPHQGGLHTIKDAVENVINILLGVTTGGIGVVTKTCVSKPTTKVDITTSKEEDQVLHDKYQDGDLVYYNLWWQNCNHRAAQNQGVGTGH